jgi:hypothetical protein
MPKKSKKPKFQMFIELKGDVYLIEKNGKKETRTKMDRNVILEILRNAVEDAIYLACDKYLGKNK